jgi:hypothetical protein
MFNGFENYFITEAVNKAIKEAEADIKKLEETGRRTIYSPGFFEMIGEGILKKLDKNTMQSYIKERDKK